LRRVAQRTIIIDIILVAKEIRREIRVHIIPIIIGRCVVYKGAVLYSGHTFQEDRTALDGLRFLKRKKKKNKFNKI
jgi:hypothetical protein